MLEVIDHPFAMGNGICIGHRLNEIPVSIIVRSFEIRPPTACGELHFPYGFSLGFIHFWVAPALREERTCRILVRPAIIVGECFIHEQIEDLLEVIDVTDVVVQVSLANNFDLLF